MARKHARTESQKNAAKAAWIGGSERRKLRAAAQEAAHRRNLASGTSPWTIARSKRYERHVSSQASGSWTPAIRNSLGLIQRTDGKRTWWEDPGIKDRAHYLGVPVYELRGQAAPARRQFSRGNPR